MALGNKLSFLLLILLVASLSGCMYAEGKLSLKHKASNLFVFGDSYVDTGNTNVSTSSSWKQPYGVTFPGKPSGRYSDGLVWADFVAKYLGLSSPVPYRRMTNQPNDGVNFAFGGTGAFDTSSPYPNMTTQIDLFEKMIREHRYTRRDLASSVALVAVSGNDHLKFLREHGSTATIQEWEDFLQSILNQTLHNVQRIQSLGVNRIAVDALAPLGCVPFVTSKYSFDNCDNTTNILVKFYNQLLQVGLAKLTFLTPNAKFVYVDLYNAFSSSMENHKKRFGGNKLKPCCMGNSPSFTCGGVDTNGVKQYTVCRQPLSSFFWDMFHPTYRGWMELYSSLRSNLSQILI